MVGDLGPLLDHVPAWLLVLFRLSGIFILAPILGSVSIPMQVKAFLVIALSLCVYPVLLDSGRPSAAYVGSVVDGGLSLWVLVPAVIRELAIGYAIGFAASLPLIGMQIGGYVIDQQIGIGAAGIFNPEMGEQSGVLGEVFFLFALAIFAILGGHRLIMATLIGSFDHVPLGGFEGLDALLGLMVGLLTIMVELAVRIAAPLLCLVFLETVALGFIARTVPQLNILSVGFSLRIMIGMAVLIAFIGIAASVYVGVTRQVLHALAGFFAA